MPISIPPGPDWNKSGPSISAERSLIGASPSGSLWHGSTVNTDRPLSADVGCMDALQQATRFRQSSTHCRHWLAAPGMSGRENSGHFASQRRHVSPAKSGSRPLDENFNNIIQNKPKEDSFRNSQLGEKSSDISKSLRHFG